MLTNSDRGDLVNVSEEEWSVGEMQCECECDSMRGLTFLHLYRGSCRCRGLQWPHGMSRPNC